MQTPQAFAFAALLEAHRRAAAAKAARISPTMPRSPNGPGIKVAMFAGEAGNVKLTTDEDFAKAEARRHRQPCATCASATASTCTPSATAITSWLGGVRIPHDRGLTGHSDADVALHALVDAILGALADGDIGKHFPPSDPQLARRLVRSVPRNSRSSACSKRGGRIAHLDVTIVCEAPRIGPHRDAMRKRIAEIAEHVDRARRR